MPKEFTFVSTENYRRFEQLIRDVFVYFANLELAAVFGRAGRGKTTAARRIASINHSRTEMPVTYLTYEGWMSPVAVLREVTFRVTGSRPMTSMKCVNLLREELIKLRRVIVVDEADRMTVKHLNVLRDIHDTCGVPVVFVGEEELRGKLAEERRLISRISQELTFDQVTALDVVAFYKANLSVEVTPEQTAALAKHAEGDFRLVVKDALRVERALRASGLSDIPDDLVKGVCS